MSTIDNQKSEKNMITPKDVVKKALEYLMEVAGEFDKPKNIALEGIRKASDGWAVDVSYERGSDDGQANSLDILLGRSSRSYKTIRLDPEGNGTSLETTKTS